MGVIVLDPAHGCEGGGSVGPGVIPIQQHAASSCCGAVLQEGGTDEAGHTCTGCGKPTGKVMGPPTMYWGCGDCGETRSQVVELPADGVAKVVIVPPGSTAQDVTS